MTPFLIRLLNVHNGIADMTFVHDGNKPDVDGLVNFEKMHMLAKIMKTLRYCRSHHLGKYVRC